MLLRSGTGCVGIPDLNCLFCACVLSASSLPMRSRMRLQLSATNVSESNPDLLSLVYPDHNTGYVYSQLLTGKPERQPDGGAWCQGTSPSNGIPP